MIGRTLNHYIVSALIGRGGMGEVYRAQDQKLGREVAIKVLPEELARDFDRVARFQREAKLLASLNHPNIAAIYGLEESGGTQFLVLELVEGETLADQLKRGPIPVEECMKLTLQIAEALEAAHEKGVIHRDLKPANIKVTPEGKVKVLDFGLAKAFAGEQADLNMSNSPTLSVAATQQGMILGTAAYMSPEQAKGKSVDKRTDVWAFGCVLFEMLTGRSVFAADDVSQTLARVLERQPDFSSLPANLHPKIVEMLERCLEKDARNRYSGISDARVDIQKALATPGGVLAQPLAAAAPHTKWRPGLWWVLAAITLTAILAGVAGWGLKPLEPRQITRFSYELPADQQFGDLYDIAVAVSPDGRQFVYSTNAGLYLRSLDDLDAKLIPGTGGSRRPFFSPDGKWIGFFSSRDRKLKKVAITGGAATTLADVDVLGYFSWNADDTIIWGSGREGIMRVSDNGGTPEPIIKAAGNGGAIHPQILPDGKSVLCTLIKSPSEKIVVQSLQSGQRKVLLEGHASRYLPSGHIVYAFGNNLFAAQFDPKALKVVGGSVSMVDNVLWTGGAPQYAVSDSGTLVYLPGTGNISRSRRTLIWVDRNGKEEPIAAEPHNYATARISPDGAKVALSYSAGSNRDIWIGELAPIKLNKLTFGPAFNVCPLWTRDGRQIVFASNRDGNLKIHWKAADGTGKDELLCSVPKADIVPADWSSDGKNLVFTERTGSNLDIGMLSMEGDRKHRQLLNEKYNEAQPRISPNGRWMAYTSDELGQLQIYVRPFPDVDSGLWQVSTGGGDSPLWSHDGRELFYHSGDTIMDVPVKTDSTFSFETPRVLFKGTYDFPAPGRFDLSIDSHYNWDISQDAKHFLMIKPIGATTPSDGGPRKINVVLNWLEELKQRVK